MQGVAPASMHCFAPCHSVVHHKVLSNGLTRSADLPNSAKGKSCWTHILGVIPGDPSRLHAFFEPLIQDLIKDGPGGDHWLYVR